MSRAELADAVNAYLWQRSGRRSALDAHTIARYERGAVRWPSAAYRCALRAVLGVATDADLGFQPTARGRGASHRPDVLAAVPVIENPEAEQVPLSRRDLLRSGLATAALGAGPGSLDRDPADSLRELVRLQALDRSQGPEPALAGVRGLVSDLQERLHGACGSDRAQLLRIASRAAEFLGFLYRDLGDDTGCLYWHDRAMEWAQQADDPGMQAYVLLRKAQAAYDQRDAARMLDLTLAARRHPTALTPGLQAEIEQQHARADAMLGAGEHEVRRRLDLARAALTRSGSAAAPDAPGAHYSVELLDLQTAVCLTEAGRPAVALPLFGQVIARATDTRDRAYFQVLHATSLALSGEPDEAARIGKAAIPTAVTTRSRRTLREASNLVEALRPWQKRRQVHELAAVLTHCRSAL